MKMLFEIHRRNAGLCLILLFSLIILSTGGSAMDRSDIIQLILDKTEPLEYERGDRLPLYLWAMWGTGTDDPEESKRILKELEKRGLAVFALWNYSNKEESLKEALALGRMQQDMGLPVNINANALLYSFYDGTDDTAHLDEQGEAFFDPSFGKKYMGCPFRLEHRIPAIRQRVEYFADAYKEAGIAPHFVFADWEVDGPIEWNGAWEASKRCSVCRKNIPHIDNFIEFQRALREIRCRLQREAYARVLTSRFPEVLVGNYGVYPHDGWRYWYDYFEDFEGPWPHKTEQQARYRPWYHEFPHTGFTYAMPTVYTWYDIFNWYHFGNPDYRWFYNLLKVSTNACRHTPPEVPIISFVHRNTTVPPKDPDPAVKQFSVEAHQELLWHMLLRGNDTFFLWCRANQFADEVPPLHQVYRESFEYNEFIEKGAAINFEIPGEPGTVISGLRLGDQVLVRRTDFGDNTEPVRHYLGEYYVDIPSAPGKCQVLEIQPIAGE
jgi:hypothetical protein